jgi:hypothetical protein
MGDINPGLMADYFVGIRRERSSWAWEIHRRSRPMGVRIREGDFRTEQSARLAGEKALRDFLERLSEEERG